MFLRAKFFLFFVVLGSIFSQAVSSEERIKFFDCSMTIYDDNSMTVTEKITVYASGHAIKRGIMREFPTDYKMRLGFNFSMGFNVEKVTMNDKPAPYRLEPYQFGQRIYIGDPQIFLRNGVYTFEIKYHVTSVCAFFKEHDELYWNVTGNEWRLDIAQVRARVHLPSSVPSKKIKYSAYTGPYGSQGNAFKAFPQSNGSIEFETTKVLKQGEGLTIVVGWPKGYVIEPSKFQNSCHFFYNNLEILLLLFFLMLLLLYLSFLYVTRCRIHTQTTIIPRFEAPENISPGSVYYLKHFGFGGGALTAEIVEMARAGYLKIENTKDGWLSYNYYLHDALVLDDGTAASTADGSLYKELHKLLFKKGKTLKLSKESSDVLEEVNDYLKDYYSKKYDETYLVFLRTHLYMALTFFCFGAIMPIGILCNRKDDMYLIPLLILVPSLIFFYYKLRTYTSFGKRVVDEIDGFKMFLQATETERLKIIGTPPTRTPELYETYLPYAIALGVEDAWARQFASVFEHMKAQGMEYIPFWYTGHGRRFTPHSFTQSFASSIRPVVSSSSGFSGRGSSGGGRGGGGGGGW